ncbi:hypothetical protein B0H13DRAFT_1947078, partial [Mycena leptocephala]
TNLKFKIKINIKLTDIYMWDYSVDQFHFVLRCWMQLSLFLVVSQFFGLPGTHGVIFWVSSCRYYLHVQSLLSFVHGWLIDWTAPLLCFSARNSREIYPWYLQLVLDS